MVILPQTSPREGYQVAERLREKIAARTFNFASVTVSVGVSTYPLPSPGKDILIQHADAAMYTAKNRGKNRVEVYKPAAK